MCVIAELEKAGEVTRAGILFFRVMLQEIQECLQALSSMEFVSLLLYEHRPQADPAFFHDIDPQEINANVVLVHDMLKAAILFSQQEMDSASSLEEWDKWKFVSLGKSFLFLFFLMYKLWWYNSQVYKNLLIVKTSS